MARQGKPEPAGAGGEPAEKGRRHRLGRVAFYSVQEAVMADLAAGWSAQAIYDRHAEQLAGRISYQQFARYVRPLRPTRAEAAPLSPSQNPSGQNRAATSQAAASPMTRQEGKKPDAGHAAPSRDFRHSPVVQEGEPESLLGPGFIRRDQ